MPAQQIITGGDVVTMNPHREVLVGGSIVIDGDVIVAVGSTTELRAEYPGRRAVFDASRCVITPGMIDAHQHLTGDPLVRSCIPDLLPPGASIFEWSVPLHGAHDALDDGVSATLSAVEALTSGVTTVVEAGTVAHADSVAEALHTVGLRATLGVWGWDIEEGPFAAPCDEVLDRQRAVVEAYPGRRAGRGMGHAGRSRPRVGFAAGGSRRSRPRARHRDDDAPLTDLVRPRALSGAHTVVDPSNISTISACSAVTS